MKFSRGKSSGCEVVFKQRIGIDPPSVKVLTISDLPNHQPRTSPSILVPSSQKLVRSSSFDKTLSKRNKWEGVRTISPKKEISVSPIQLQKLVTKTCLSSPEFSLWLTDFVMEQQRVSVPHWKIAHSLDARNNVEMLRMLAQTPPLKTFLKAPCFYQELLRSESDLLLSLHPMFTPNGVSLCPFRVLELMLQRFYERFGSIPSTLLLQTALDATLVHKGGLGGTKALTPWWFFIVPNEERYFDYDDSSSFSETPSLSMLDYFPLGYYMGSDSAFSIKRNCNRLIEFHRSLSVSPFLTFNLSCGEVTLPVERTLCLDKSALADVNLDGESLHLCAICDKMTKKKDKKTGDIGVKSGEVGDPIDEDRLVTIFRIKASLLFSDVCFHCPKRFMENLLDRLLRQIVGGSEMKAADKASRNILISIFEEWMMTCFPSFEVRFQEGGTHPSPMKLTYTRMKSLLLSASTYLPMLEKESSLKTSLDIWKGLGELMALSKTKSKDLTSAVVMRAKEVGAQLHKDISNVFLEDTTTPYQHEFCLHIATFLERARSLKTSLRVIADLQLMERNNNSFKVL
jgi:hypothetical protein